jgi:hypothetical protein
MDVIRGFDPEFIPSIADPRFDPDYSGDDNDDVIVVETPDSARAYPVPILDLHHMVNDEVDGTPVVVTWCPLCGSGVVYDRTVDDRTLTFEFAGKLADNNFVMRDRETGSEWKQSTGECLSGELEGERLFTDPEEGEHMVKGQNALDQAQVANDLFSLELADRLEGAGVSVTVVNPGAVDTDIRLRADNGWRQVDEMIRSEMGVVSPETVAEMVVALATAAEPAEISGRFFRTGREEIEVQAGARDAGLRRELWERSATLSGLTDD